MIIKRRAFTLIELIISLAIIAILSIVVFVTISGYILNARDSKRETDLTTLSKAFRIYNTQKSTYPMPDPIEESGSIITGGLDNRILVYRGIIGKKVIKYLKPYVNITKVPKDPFGNKYPYGITFDKKYYQIARIDESDQVSNLVGDYKGYILYSTGGKKYIYNFPSLIIIKK